MGKDAAFSSSQTPQQRCGTRDQLFDNTLVSKEHTMCFLLSLQCNYNKFPSKN